MADFSGAKPQERQYSDVESVQAPVARTDKGMSMSGFAQGVSAFAGAASDVYGMVSTSNENKAKKDFDAKLVDLSLMAEQQGTGSPKFKAAMVEAYRGSSLDPSIKTQMMNSFQSTVVGKSIAAPDPAVEADKALTEAVYDLRMVKIGASPEEVEAAKDTLIKNQEAQAARASAIAELEYKNKKLTYDSAERKEGEARLISLQQKNLANLAVESQPTFNGKVNDILTRYRAGLDRKTAESELKSLRGTIDDVVSAGSTKLTSAQTAHISSPLYTQIDLALSNMDSANILKEMEVKQKEAQYATWLNLQLKDPELAEQLNLLNMMKNSSVSLQVKVSEGVEKYFVNNADPTKKPSDPTAEDTDTSTYLSIISDNIRDINKPNTDGSTRDPVVLATQVGQIVAGGARSFRGDDLPEQNANFIKWLNNNSAYLREANLPAGSSQKLSESLSQSLENFIYPKVQASLASYIKAPTAPTEARTSRSGRSTVTTVAEAPTRTVGKRSGRSQIISPATMNDVELVESGGKVEWVATSIHGRQAAKSLNEETSPALTNYFGAMSGVTGTSMSEILEESKMDVWPEKYSVETEEPAVETAAPENAPAQAMQFNPEYEGKAVRDANGDIWIGRNGTYTKVRGDSDAKQ